MTAHDEDLRRLSTEAVGSDFRDLDKASTAEILRVISTQDALVAPAVAKALPAIEATVEAAVQAIRNGGRIVYVGAGTSGRIGVLDAAECGPTFNAADIVIAVIAGGFDAMIRAVEGAEDDGAAAIADLERVHITSRDLVIGLTASGRTPYVRSAVEHAHALGAATAGVSCNLNAELNAIVDHAIAVETGPEVIAGSTRMKAATAQKMILNMISSTTMVRLGRTYGNMMSDLSVSNEKLRRRAIRIIAQVAGRAETEAEAALDAHAGDVRAAVDALTASR